MKEYDFISNPKEDLAELSRVNKCSTQDMLKRVLALVKCINMAHKQGKRLALIDIDGRVTDIFTGI